jgi:tyrosyl-tRNA synthetase
MSSHHTRHAWLCFLCPCATSVPWSVLGDASVHMYAHWMCVSGNCVRSVMAKKMLAQGGVYLNNERVTDPELRVTLAHTIDETMCVLRTGKKNQIIVRVQD